MVVLGEPRDLYITFPLISSYVFTERYISWPQILLG